MKGTILFKSGGKLKDVDVKGRTVTGYFSAFGNKDSDGDIITQGAFTKTIHENGPQGSNRVAFLWQHDYTQPLGKPHVLKEDNFGLYFEAKVPDTTWGTNALKLYDAGVINEHSVGFQTIKSADRGTYNELQELKLWEGSAVTWGANSQTPFTGMKSMITKEKFADKLDRLYKGIESGAFVGENSYLLVLAFNEVKSMYEAVSEPLTAVPELNAILAPLKSNPAAIALDPQGVLNALNALKSKLS